MESCKTCALFRAWPDRQDGKARDPAYPDGNCHACPPVITAEGRTERARVRSADPACQAWRNADQTVPF